MIVGRYFPVRATRVMGKATREMVEERHEEPKTGGGPWRYEGLRTTEYKGMTDLVNAVEELVEGEDRRNLRERT